jgi:hypothetical protein
VYIGVRLLGYYHHMKTGEMIEQKEEKIK